MEPIVTKELSVGELALILGVSECTIKRLARDGEIPCEYRGRRLRFRFEAVVGRFRELEGGAKV